jgi:hypothetical protein
LPDTPLKKAFYPASDFYVYKDSSMFGGSTPSKLKFPSYMLMSENYFHRVWTLNAHRRLKNVIVLLEWIPSYKEVKTVANTQLDPLADVKGVALSPDMKTRLLRAFEMYNISHSGALSAVEFKELLRSLEVDVSDQPALSAIYAEVRTAPACMASACMFHNQSTVAADWGGGFRWMRAGRDSSAKLRSKGCASCSASTKCFPTAFIHSTAIDPRSRRGSACATCAPCQCALPTWEAHLSLSPQPHEILLWLGNVGALPGACKGRRLEQAHRRRTQRRRILLQHAALCRNARAVFVQADRGHIFVAISLDEAEHIRGIMHHRMQGRGNATPSPRAPFRVP